ncbi:unnamed protein product [Rotaria magnacalcarata]|uniref:Uncharacterized protein n=1 Tax=Rotaria magnacalcarata TaxID=392030 RepID=A0A8S2QU21_9BILA|nr:unnamed protein product [Rotaria magnacalcarata]
MPDTANINRLPLRTTGSTRWPRKWSTIGGRGATSSSTTMIPAVDSDSTENPTQTHNNNNNNNRHSTSLLRKSSTISRTNDKSNPSNENLDPTLKKSRSLMNVLRYKFNSPAVLRRFRSKSRESTKQAVTEVVNGHTPNEQPEVKQSNDEQISTRKSRKRDPSPIRRFANCISQLGRHQRAKSTDRPKQSPSKSIINDLQNEERKSPSPSPANNQDKVDHINACYDEIRAKYFTDNDIKKRNALNDDTNNRSLSTISVNGSLLSNDFLSNIQRVPIPIIPDDPLLQARKQSNIKLNCLLSGYTLTRSFANHEKLFGQNDLFKSNHFYDVEKRRYDWNYTNHNNRLFSSMRTKPISKSIDNFRHTNTHDNQVSIVLEKANIVNNDTLVQNEKHKDVSRILPNDSELVICENSDLIDSDQNLLHHSPNIDVTPTSPINVTTFMPTFSNPSDKINDSSNEHRAEETDEEFERNFLRAVNRALGVVNKDQSNLTQAVPDATNEKDESHLNLIQMTERALSSLNNTTLFTNEDQSNELSDNSTELTSVELVTSPNELLTAEDTSEIVNENETETSNDEDTMSVIEDLLRKTEDILFEETKVSSIND